MADSPRLRDSRRARWTALALVSFTMFCAYYFYQAITPLKPMLESQLGWTSSQFGFFRSALGWFNVFLFMLIFGGMILDRMGVRFTGLMSAGVMALGAAIQTFALVHAFPAGATILGVRSQVMVAALGLAFFNMGSEIAGVTVSKVVVRWFKGREMALAMGLQVAIARIGTGIALGVSAPMARAIALPAPLAAGLLLLCIGFLSYFFYCRMDRSLEQQDAALEAPESEEAFHLHDVFLILRNRGFWLIALLCVLFYGAVFPFLDFSNDFMTQKFGMRPSLAGIIPSLLPFGTILLTPFFGGLYDRKGKGATLMILGAALLVLVHGLLAVPMLHHWSLALAATLVLGVSFSLVPSSMWPSTAKIIPEKQLGTAFALIFYIQNIGLSGVPALIGWVLDRFCRSVDAGGAVRYDYTLPMLIFTCFGVLGLCVAYQLKREDRRRNYGLERPNRLPVIQADEPSPEAACT